MTFTLLYIRLQQLKKEANALGLYLFVIIGILFLLIFAAFKQFQNSETGFYAVLVMAIICVAMHAYRKDTPFIYKHIEKPHTQIFTEYAALTLPFSLTCIVTKSWYCFPLLLVLLYCIPYLKFLQQKKTVFKNLSSIIPIANFEWISGYRKNYISFISIYLLAAAFCWVRILPLFLLWFLTIMIASFFYECESLNVLREGDASSQKKLNAKLAFNILTITGLYIPLITVNIIFNREFLVFNLLFVPIQISLLSFAICLKYSSYKPNKNLTGNSIPLAIVGAGCALPYFLPVPVILSFIYFYKATNNLKNYLDD